MVEVILIWLYAVAAAALFLYDEYKNYWRG